VTDLSRRTLLGSGLAAGIGLFVLVRGSGPAEAAMTFQITHSAQEWRRMLGAQRYAVLREAHTEAAGSSPLLKEHRRGTFACAGCGQALFSSTTKFESGTGWPSFWQALPGAVARRTDRTFGMERTEILCRRCGGHLGHLFDDGPKPTGLRYCMNGLALAFRPA
jgi:peptide-methionine (R)-S-oxide reductase